ILDLPRITDTYRRPEADFWRAFDAARPRILGAMLDAVSGALRGLPDVRLDALPRMADFALWATAAEPALGWEPGQMLRAYTANRADAHEVALEASPVAAPVRTLAAEGPWTGTASRLHGLLSDHVDEATRRLPAWPKTGRAIAGILRRLAPNLRAVG